MLDPAIERWKKYLRRDPTRWLLETDDPSIVLWYQLAIAHRPEDAPGVISTRERVLYSDAVQTIFRAQNEWGFWENKDSLAQPYYRATLWDLALLAELGVPRTSRRVRLACEFVLQNFLNDDETFAGLRGVESGYLIHALAYFNLAQDERVIKAAHALANQLDSYEAQICALWAWSLLQEDEIIRAKSAEMMNEVLPQTFKVSNTSKVSPYTFPQFIPRDELFVLRVLAEYDRIADPRATPLVDALIAKQDEQARWTLEQDLNAQLLTPFEQASEPSRWVTLNALRVIVKLVGAG